VLDIKRLRAEPDAARAALARRDDPDLVALLDSALALDEARRDLIGQVEELKQQRNKASKEVGERKRRGEEAAELIDAMQGVAQRIRELDAELAEVDAELRTALLGIPNLPHPRLPDGGADSYEIVAEWGDRPAESAELRPHWEIGTELGVLDFERGAKLAGSGFPLFVGEGARLVRALLDFMLDMHTRQHGYTEVAPPFLANRASMTGTGQLPKFEEDMYRTDPDDLFMIPTAEVPVTNLHRDEVLEGDDLPIAYTAYTPCFRREAGAAGRDTRGLLRVHQFDKVELVRLTRPDESEAELERLTDHAERVLRELEIPYRKILLAAGDIGFSNAITYDLEAWAGGVREWLEVSSCSSFTDYQARRMGIRYRPAPNQPLEFVHTLNGSGVALPRTIIALLENGQQPDGTIRLPAALHSYFGAERIEPS
jgi:seryl-tRNA synthetase